MSRERLKLTAYFGERDRTPERLLADELLDIYGEHHVQASVLLRGSEGFGRLHHLRTDRLLSLSEDLPVAAVALDTPARIESLLEQVVAVKQRGLITLERARMISCESGSAALGDALHGYADASEATAGLQAVAGVQTAGAGDAAAAGKLTIYVGRRERVGGKPAFAVVCEVLHRAGMAGASVLLGVDGSRRGQRARARFFSGNADVPMMIIAVGSRSPIARALSELAGMLHEPLMTFERVRVCKRDGQLLDTPHELPGADPRGRALWQKLTVYSSQSATYDGRPLHLEIVRRLRASDAAGATCLAGVWGFHGAQPPHGDRLLQIRRHVPIVTIAIDSPERAARSFQIIDELTSERGLVTSEIVPAMRALSAAGQLGTLHLADPRV
jgi:PII-like signaling protein